MIDHKNIPCIGGPIDGAVVDFAGRIISAPVPPPDWPRTPPDSMILKTQYELRRIEQEWLSLSLSGHAYVWSCYRGDPVVAVMSRLLAQNMKGDNP